MASTLVTGATGFIGSHVVGQLPARGDDVVATVRPRSSESAVAALHARGVRAVEVRAASLDWAFSNRRAKRELGWTTSPHEDCLEETIAWYLRRDGQMPSPGSTRQALPLRVAGALAKRLPL
jgi:nucleoside-diphosphate-sugar epimerase